MVRDHLAVMIATGHPQDLQKKSQKKSSLVGHQVLGGGPLIHYKLWDGAGQPSPCRECMSLDC